jgi:uncharacterized membrane protein
MERSRARSGAENAKGGTSDLAAVVERNIATLIERRRNAELSIGWQERLANAITRLTGSMAFVYLHLAMLVLWIVINLGLVPSVKPWDPSFIILATGASVEAIFLSTFILITQNRLAEADRRRADLDLQMSLLAEHEVTKVISLVSSIADHLGVKAEVDRHEIEELKQDVAPEAVLDKLDNLEPP